MVWMGVKAQGPKGLADCLKWCLKPLKDEWKIKNHSKNTKSSSQLNYKDAKRLIREVLQNQLKFRSFASGCFE